MVNFCFSFSNEGLRSSGGHVQLLRNGFPIETGECVNVQLYHVRNLTVDDAGEYECKGYYPNNDSIVFRTEIRDLVVLGE